MNKHCDFVDIDKVYQLMQSLKINKTQLANLAGVSTVQVRNWERKGRAPQYRFSQILIELQRAFKEEYDRKMEIINFY